MNNPSWEEIFTLLFIYFTIIIIFLKKIQKLSNAKFLRLSTFVERKTRRKDSAGWKKPSLSRSLMAFGGHLVEVQLKKQKPKTLNWFLINFGLTGVGAKFPSPSIRFSKTCIVFCICLFKYSDKAYSKSCSNVHQWSTLICQTF